MDIDPDRLRAIVGALGGVAVYGLVQVGALSTGERANLRDLTIRLACATASAVISAGGNPVLMDTDPATLSTTAASASKARIAQSVAICAELAATGSWPNFQSSTNVIVL